MTRFPLIALAALLVAGCGASVATITARPSASAVSADEVARGADLYRFRAPSGRWGFMEADGTVVIPADYDGVSEFQEGRAVMYRRGRAGVIDPSGRVVAEPIYDEVDLFIDGRARVAVGEGSDRTYGYIDPSGQEIVEPTLPEATVFGDGLGVVRLRETEPVGLERLLARLGVDGFSSHYVAVDPDGEVAVVFDHEYVGAFAEGLAAFRPQSGRGWGYLGTDGTVVIAPRFGGTAYGFSDGLARVVEGGRVGFIDRSGAFVIPPTFDAAGPFAQDRAAVQVDGLWGYVDRAGALVIAPRFQEAGPFSEGLAPVQVDGLWGYVGLDGEVVIEPQYRRVQAFRGGLALVYQGGAPLSIRRDGARVAPSDL